MSTAVKSGRKSRSDRITEFNLRHLHATTLLLAGIPVHVVTARLGRADPSVTLRVYSDSHDASMR